MRKKNLFVANTLSLATIGFDVSMLHWRVFATLKIPRPFRRLGFLFLIILLGFLILPGITIAQLADSPWPMFHGNLRHTGLSPYDTSSVDGSVKWIFKTEKGMESSPAIGSDGTIYIGSHDNRLYALNPDGTEKWHFQVGTGPVFSKSGTAGFDAWKGILSSPAVANDGTIYFTSMNNKLFALNSDGSEKWDYDLELSVDIWSSPAIGKDGTVYVGSHDNFNGRLYAINPDGSEKWYFQTQGDISSSPAIDEDGTIYIATGDNHLYALDDNGKKKWSFTFSSFADSSPAIANDGTIYVGSTREGALYALNRDGSKKWDLKLGTSIDVWSSPAIGNDGTVYIGSDDGYLWAVKSDGLVKWKFTFNGDSGFSPAIGADGTIYTGGGKIFFAINPDGTEKWRFNKAEAASSPAIGKDGTIYLGTWSGLYAFGDASSAMKEETSEEAIKRDPVFGPAQCQSGGLTTSVFKDYQMSYVDEDFIQINNLDLLKDVSQLKDLTCLQYMDATDRTVKGDIANLKNLKELVAFSLYSNPDVYGDICSLAGATKLRSLKFAFNPKITGDISCLKDLTKLETFAMTHTNITGDISVFADMPNLKAIYISGTYIKGDICALSKLTNLEDLGIADEYPGNPDITGDLSCLDNLQKLKRVSIYNTGTTNCEQFTKMHPNLDKTVTESGKQGGGGCSKESLKTLVDYAQKYERKIGKEVQTEVRGKPNYQPIIDNRDNYNEENQNEPDNRSFFAKIIDWVKGLFSKKTASDISTISGRSAPDNGPPEDCTIDGKFIGESACKAMMEKRSPDGASAEAQPDDGGPPAECTINGKFIGEAQCKAMMEGSSPEQSPQNSVGNAPADGGPPAECTVNGNFIGEEECKAMIENSSSEENR